MSAAASREPFGNKGNLKSTSKKAGPKQQAANTSRQKGDSTDGTQSQYPYVVSNLLGAMPTGQGYHPNAAAAAAMLTVNLQGPFFQPQRDQEQQQQHIIPNMYFNPAMAAAYQRAIYSDVALFPSHVQGSSVPMDDDRDHEGLGRDFGLGMSNQGHHTFLSTANEQQQQQEGYGGGGRGNQEGQQSSRSRGIGGDDDKSEEYDEGDDDDDGEAGDDVDADADQDIDGEGGDDDDDASEETVSDGNRGAAAASTGGAQHPQHATLGQMAEQIQAKARRDQRLCRPSIVGVGSMATDDEYDEYGEELGGGGGVGRSLGCLSGAEQTGRWTRKEHDLFLEALKKFGKEWKKVASMVKTRTVVQTRTHAQKYFQKVSKNGSLGMGGGMSMSMDVTDASTSGGTISSGGKKGGPGAGAGAGGGNLSTRGSGGAAGNNKGSGVASVVTAESLAKKTGGGSGAGGAAKKDHHQKDKESMAGGSHKKASSGAGAGAAAYNGGIVKTSSGGGDHGRNSTSSVGGASAADIFERDNQQQLMLHQQLLLHQLQQHQQHHQQHQQQEAIRPTMKITLPLMQYPGIIDNDTNSSSGGSVEFPRPSPAACGKRKVAELTAAQVLASSSASSSSLKSMKKSSPDNIFVHPSSVYRAAVPRPSVPAPSALSAAEWDEADPAAIMVSLSTRSYDGAQVLATLKDFSQISSSFSVVGGATRQQQLQQQQQQEKYNKATARSLSILNPDTIYPRGAAAAATAANAASDNTTNAAAATPSEGGLETPWESEVRALEQARNTSSSSSSLATGAALNPTSSSLQQLQLRPPTPSDHNEFLRRVISSIKKGGDDGCNELEQLLKSAEGLSGTLLRKTSIVPTISGAVDMDYEDRLIKAGEDACMGVGSGSMGFSMSATGAGVDTPQLIAIGRALNRPDPDCDGVTALMHACALHGGPDRNRDPRYSEDTVLSLCRTLLRYGASPQIADARGATCLHRIAASGYEKVGRLLLIKNCPVNATNIDGDAAIHIAAREGQSQVIEMLADFGADCHLRNASARAAIDVIGSTSSTFNDRDSLRRTMLTVEPRLRTLILYHEDCLEHTAARRSSEWEGPDRMTEIMHILQDKSEFRDYELEITTHFQKASVDLLTRVHSAEYIAFVDTLSKEVQQREAEDSGGSNNSTVPFTPQVQRVIQGHSVNHLKKAEYCDTTFSTGTLRAARRAAGAVAFAVDRVLTGQNRNAFCVVRPPGHHAGFQGLLDGGKSCGFCIFNNIAVGALHALNSDGHNCPRVAIIDLDIHHGNGTEDIVRRYPHPSRLFFFSLHLFEKEFSSATSAGEAVSASAPRTSTSDHQPVPAAVPATVPLFSSSPSPSSSSSLSPSDTQQQEPGTTDTDAHISSSKNKIKTRAMDKNHRISSTYEFFPGSGEADDTFHNIINVPIAPLWVDIATATATSSLSNNSDDNHEVTKLSPASHGHSTGSTTSSTGSGGLSGSISSQHSNHNQTGREAYMSAIDKRLIPSLRAFNPDLILLSTGFDGAKGDVGNCRTRPSPTAYGGSEVCVGMDLQEEDFERVTSKILEIADLCCAGRVVSVLEGGYGSYDKPKPSTRATRTTKAENGSDGEPTMNRSTLAAGAASHVRRLVDPYGPRQHSSHSHNSRNSHSHINVKKEQGGDHAR